MPLDPQSVARYLREHPEFFEDFAPLLAEIQLPHPHGGRAISISERQVLTLREKNRLLEGKLAELIQFGEENDAIGEKVHRLAAALLGARNVDHVFDIVYSYLGDDFTVPHIAIRIWGIPEASEAGREQRDEFAQEASRREFAEIQGRREFAEIQGRREFAEIQGRREFAEIQGRREFAPVAPEIHTIVLGMASPLCGQHAIQETLAWFGEDADKLASFALVPLKHNDLGGLLVLASEDQNRFYAEMGTLFLKRIGELVGCAVAARV